ncbi:glycoside hydrolase family 3 C-terminal domain-containing protein [Catenulispora sp. MAP5-51]|uniref:glycoside hydrolase family 3 C-terminal domain-containing protein n=1 Tax=unclassified Catenulispora TaxID=414885 RepID=UPI00351504BA
MLSTGAETASAGTASASGISAACPWVHSSAPIPQRVSQLLSRMTIDQEIAVMAGTGGTRYPGSTPAIGSLCIPAMNLNDGPAGVGDDWGMTGATQLPAPVDIAATWDTGAEQTYGQVIGAEQAAKGATVELGPTINIVRDPRWGRAFETVGEDPYLNGQMGAANIRGVQSTGVMAQLKHLAAYNQETYRNKSPDNAIISDQALQEIYLPAFQTAVQQGAPSSVMCSYNWINNTPACQNTQLLDSVLRKQFGFTGFITSDWDGGLVDDNNNLYQPYVQNAANAGLDQDMPPTSHYNDALKTAYGNGSVSKSTIDNAVSLILTQMFAFGQFDQAPTGSPAQPATNATDQSAATQLAAEGTVLLKNSGNTLPLAASTSSIAVIGDDAGSHAQSGGGGSAEVHADTLVTPYQGIAARAGAGIKTQYVPGSVTAALPTVPSSALTPSAGSGNGLTTTFYPTTDLSGAPALTRTDPAVDFDWGGNSPGPGIAGTSWSAKWTGTLTAPTTGTYTFSLNSDDGSRLLVNGQTIVDNWSDHASTTAYGTVTLTAGQPVPVEVDYYQNGGGSNLSLGWEPPGTGPINDAVTAARNSDVPVVFASTFEAEGSDLPSIDLPWRENQLISAVAAANPHTIVVLNTGSAVTMPWINQVAGVFEAWYPGQEDGNAIASLLFGDTNPSGHLPVTFPKSLSDVPASTTAQWPGTNSTVQYSEGVDVGYRWYDAKNITPLFPFGYGQSYTSFSFSNLHVGTLPQGGAATVTATVTNTGARAGADVAQLYLTQPSSAGEPVRQLQGFDRVDLQAGQSKTVTFELTQRNLQHYDTTDATLTTSTGDYGISVGDAASDANLPLKGTLSVTPTQIGQPLALTNPGPQEGPTGTAVSLQAAAADTTSGQTPDFTATGLPVGTVISPTGQITGTPTTPATSTVTITATDSAGALATTSFLWTVVPAEAAVATPLIGPGGKCLDLAGGNNNDTNKVEVYDCNGTTAQQWSEYSDGTVRASGTCLDVAGAGTNDGTRVQIYTCNGSGAQIWQHQANGALLNPNSGKCLTDPESTATNGTQVVIDPCTGAANQSWVSPIHTITGVGSGRCVDIPAADTTGSPQLQLYDCNSTAAQTWSQPGDGTIRSLGECLDVAGASSNNNTPVDISTCNGTAAQQWTYNPTTHQLTAFGKCLDATSLGTNNGTKLQLFDCYGTSNQQWNLP